MPTMTSAPKSAISCCACATYCGEGGMAAVEFALILPVHAHRLFLAVQSSATARRHQSKGRHHHARSQIPPRDTTP